ncbi:hypothetical protein Cgig2_031547 [Carnegiea gigantea]|uniref:Uncharacterized protein n=1 Tax=Carnegiea gigantea TaxID=171969 RepID=A0A9Q1JJS1_9CARY|nr:hypothetical protein Cgig2_031547 [Carnegiea gigantea]
MFDFTHVSYQAHSLSYHTLIVLDFPVCPRPKKAFLFCDMWVKNAQFKDIVKHTLDKCIQDLALQVLKHFLCNLRKPLKLLNKTNLLTFVPSRLEQEKHWCRSKHNYKGTLSTRTAPTRKILGDSIMDRNDQWVEGFDRVVEIMTGFYQDILGRQEQHRSPIDLQMIGQTLNIDQQMRLCQPFIDNDIKQALFSIPSFKSQDQMDLIVAFIRPVGISLELWFYRRPSPFQIFTNANNS